MYLILCNYVTMYLVLKVNSNKQKLILINNYRY